MRRPIVTAVLISVLTAAALTAAAPAAQMPAQLAGASSAPLTYRFDDVRRSVTVARASGESAAKAGQLAASGDRVRTGWFSYARLTSAHHQAHFELFSSTEVELASSTPGVILSLNRGRLQAIFDKITGNEPRIVQTPGALLAVRGTQYSVEVDAKGQTMLDVFEGTVEVRSPLRREPLLVPAGQSSTFSRQRPPDPPRPTPPGRARDDRDARAKASDQGERSKPPAPNGQPDGNNNPNRPGNGGGAGGFPGGPGGGAGGGPGGSGPRPPAPPPPRPPVE